MKNWSNHLRDSDTPSFVCVPVCVCVFYRHKKSSSASRHIQVTTSQCIFHLFHSHVSSSIITWVFLVLALSSRFFYIIIIINKSVCVSVCGALVLLSLSLLTLQQCAVTNQSTLCIIVSTHVVFKAKQGSWLVRCLQLVFVLVHIFVLIPRRWFCYY